MVSPANVILDARYLVDVLIDMPLDQIPKGVVTALRDLCLCWDPSGSAASSQVMAATAQLIARILDPGDGMVNLPEDMLAFAVDMAHRLELLGVGPKLN